jgi:tellurite resistance protein
MTTEDALAKLREPFAPNEVGLLPRNVVPNKQGDPPQPKFECTPKSGTKASKDGKYCGGYHPWSIHLDFVGHAAITKRLLEADPEWNWEPLAVTEDGLPKFDQFGGLWIKLTVAGVSRVGYGDAQGKPAGPTAVKEVIGDALRNAGMRFGMALDLWHKGDLFSADEEKGATTSPDAVKDAPPAVQAAAQAHSNTSGQVASEDAEADLMRAWIDQAAAKVHSDDVLKLWKEAKAAFGRSPSPKQRETLNSIAAFGKTLKDAELAVAELNYDVAADAQAQMGQAFGS